MGAIRRLARAADRAQQRLAPLAFAVAVVKKYGEDRAGALAAQVAYFGFVTLFPLLLALVTVLGLVAGGDPGLRRRLLGSALSEFPVIGNQLGDNIHALHRGSAAGLAVGLAGLVWGSLGGLQAAQHTMAEVWDLPVRQRPGLWARLARSALLLALVGAFLVVSTGLAGLSAFGSGASVPRRLGGAAVSLALNGAAFVGAFRVLTPRQVQSRQLVPGALGAGAAWTGLQLLGSYLVGHQLRHTSQVYGFFAIVLGLMAWIYLTAQLLLLAAEANVVWARHLWPRSLGAVAAHDPGGRQ
jgi:YihY family inner membrane protein